NALDGIVRPDVVKYPRVNVAVAASAVCGALVALGIVAAKSDAWFEARWPAPALTAVPDAAGSDGRVIAPDRYADWLLWHLPQLPGQMAADIRFELLRKQTFRRLQNWDSQVGDDWGAVARGYDVAVLDESGAGSPVAKLLAEGGWKLVYRDDKISVLRRSAA